MLTKTNRKTKRKMGYPSPTVSLSKIRSEVSLGKRKNSHLGKSKVNSTDLDTMVVGGETLMFSDDFYSLFEVYQFVIRYKCKLEKFLTKAYFEETGRPIESERIQMFLYLLHSHYPGLNAVQVPPPCFTSPYFQDYDEDWDFSEPFQFPCSVQRLEDYCDVCHQKVYLEQQLSQVYFKKTERTLSFANLDKILGLSAFQKDDAVSSATSAFVGAGDEKVRQAQRREGNHICVEENSDHELPVLTAHEFATCLKLFNLLSKGYPVDLQHIEIILVFAEFKRLQPFFSGVYPLMRWISIITYMDFAKACPQWVDAAVRSIGKRKNTCDNAYRKCTNIKVLKCCKDCHIPLTQIHLDLLSRVSLE